MVDTVENSELQKIGIDSYPTYTLFIPLLVDNV